MTQLLNDDIVRQIQQVFDEQLIQSVEVLFFGQKHDCDYCDDTRKLLEEVTAISDKLSLSIYDIDDNATVAQQYRLTMAPGIVLAGRDGDQILDYGIRFAGIPSGHEFSSLIQDIILVSARDSGLSAQTRETLKGLTKPVHLQVFVTPT